MALDHKKIIRNNYEFLRESIEPEPLADYLFKEKKITSSQHDSILDKKGRAATKECLKILKNSRWTFNSFIDFLKLDDARGFILEKLEIESESERDVNLKEPKNKSESARGDNTGESKQESESARGDNTGESKQDSESARGDNTGESKQDSESARGDNTGESKQDSESARGDNTGESKQDMVEEIRVVMFGKTGVGKSFLGNNILDQKAFCSQVAAQSVTKEAMRGERMIEKDYKLVVVDTPGLFDTDTNDIMESAKILTSTVKVTKPGPHVFIFVLSITNRYTKEEIAAIEFLKDLFGSHVEDYLIIVFTGKDNIDLVNIDFETYVDKAKDDLKNLLRQCRGNIAINNRAPREEITESINSLLLMIKNVYLKNGKKYYTDEVLAEAQEIFEEKLRLQYEEAHRRERELEEEVKKVEEEKKNVEEEARNRETKLEEEKKILEEEKQKNKNEIEVLTKNNEEAQTQYIKEKKEKDKLQRQNEEAQKRYENEKHEKEKLKSQNEEAQKRYENEKEKLKSQNEEAQKRYGNEKHEKEKLKSQNEEAQKQYENEKKEKDKLQRENEEAQKQYINERKILSDQLTEQDKKLKAMYAKQESDIQSQNQEIKSLRKEISDKNESITKLKQDLNSQEAIMEQAKEIYKKEMSNEQKIQHLQEMLDKKKCTIQ